jgi:hypothetical protein
VRVLSGCRPEQCDCSQHQRQPSFPHGWFSRYARPRRARFRPRAA